MNRIELGVWALYRTGAVLQSDRTARISWHAFLYAKRKSNPPAIEQGIQNIFSNLLQFSRDGDFRNSTTSEVRYFPMKFFLTAV